MATTLRVALPILLLLAGGAAILVYRLLQDDDDEGRYERGETEVLVTNISGGSFLAVRAGNRFADSSAVGGFDSSGTWLPAGRYYVSATSGGRQACYPVPLTGYRSGPDADGSFVVTIRPQPGAAPPPLPPGNEAFNYIPAGTFLLGDRLNPHEPHHVWLTGYFVAPFEVSNREFGTFMDATDGYADPGNWTEAGKAWKKGNPPRASSGLPAAHADHVRFGLPDQPVTLVTWFEAMAYCCWLTRTIGGGKWLYTPPSDAEWEKAARGPESFDYSLGMTLSDADIGLYNWKKNPITTEPLIGIEASKQRFRANRYGLYHMTGNVAEWTLSQPRPYDRSNPYADDSRNSGEGDASRTARGGSWYSATSASLRIPYRDAFQPGHRTQELGFRVIAKQLP